jgi:hypothetical protein
VVWLLCSKGNVDMDDQIVEVLAGLDQMEAAAKACISGDWLPGVSDSDSVESAVEWSAESIRKNDSGVLHMVFVGDPSNPEDTRIVALTGNGPHSESHAQYLTYVCPRNVLVLIEIARHELGTQEESE